MDATSARKMAGLVRGGRVAALGTLRDGAPLVTQVIYSVADDFSAFYIHVSRLAQHTQDILRDPRVSLMIAESDDGTVDPQTLARVSVRGDAVAITPDDDRYDGIKRRYLQKFPAAAPNFDLGDFMLYCVEPQSGRFVGGFGKIYNLTPVNFLAAAASDSPRMQS